MFKKDTWLPVVKQIIETGYSITENSKGNGCDIAVEAGGSGRTRGCAELGKYSGERLREDADREMFQQRKITQKTQNVK